MAPSRIRVRAAQEPWDTEEQGEYDGDDDGDYDGEYDEEYDGDYDGDYGGGYDGDDDGEYDAEWDLNSADAEEVSALPTEEPEIEEPEIEEPEIEEPAPVLAEEDPGTPSTLVSNGEASLPNEEGDSVTNLGSFDANDTPKQVDQGAEDKTLDQDKPVNLQVPQEEGPNLSPEEQAIKDREPWQMAVAERKDRLREGQMAKNDRARKLFDIFQKDRQEEKLDAAKKVVAVKSGRFRSRISKRGLVGDLGKKVVGKVADVVAEKLAEKLASKKQEKEKEKENEEAPVLTVDESSSGSIDHTFMDNLMKAVKGPNMPVVEGLPGVMSYDEDAPTNAEDPRRIHRVLKVVLGGELFEELSDLPLDTYESQDQAAREELVNKVLFAMKGNPATEKIKVELLEGLPGLGDCGLTLPLRKPLSKPVDPCELAELCTPEIPCLAADLCLKANAHEADDDTTPTITTTDNESEDAERKVSPILTLLRLFRAARVSPGALEEPKRKFYEGFRGIGKRDVGEFEAYMADLNNACSFNMHDVRKEVVGAPRKLSSNFKTVEHTITMAGATRKPQGQDEKEEGASQVSEENEEGTEDDSDGEDEERAEGESGDENEQEDSQNLPKEKPKESPANGNDDNAMAIKDSEANSASYKSTARHGNHYGWFPSTTYRRWVKPAQNDFPAMEGAPAVPAANVAPIEPVAPSTLSETAVDDLITETITVASLGPALPPSTTPESIFSTTQSTAISAPMEGIIGESTPDITEAGSTATPTDPTTTDAIPSKGLTSKERKMGFKILKSKPAHTMSKEAKSWDRKQRQRARRIRKEREGHARALRRIGFAKKLEAERARKAADRATFIEGVDDQPPTPPQYSKRAPPSPLEAHAPAGTRQGVKEEEQRWHAGEGRVSAADREEAAREIAKVAKMREAERQKGVEDAAARAAAQDDGVGNPYLDHNSYDPAQAHMKEANGARFPTYKGVGDAAPELGNVGVVVAILVLITLMVAVLGCQQRRREGSPNWARERGGRGYLRQGRKKRQSEEQEREKLDV